MRTGNEYKNSRSGPHSGPMSAVLTRAARSCSPKKLTPVKLVISRFGTRGETETYSKAPSAARLPAR